MPTAAQIREVAYTLPEADDLVVAEITHRAAVVSGLAAEQPRYYLQHALDMAFIAVPGAAGDSPVLGTESFTACAGKEGAIIGQYSLVTQS